MKMFKIEYYYYYKSSGEPVVTNALINLDEIEYIDFESNSGSFGGITSIKEMFDASIGVNMRSNRRFPLTEMSGKLLLKTWGIYEKN